MTQSAPDFLAEAKTSGSSLVPLLSGSIGDALRDAARRWPERIALVDGVGSALQRTRWTYRQLLQQAERYARALLDEFRVGDAVAIWSPNCPEWVFVEFGAALAGLTLVTVNPAYLAPELRHVLGQSDAAGLIFVPEHRGRDLLAIVDEVRGELPQLRTAITLSDWLKKVEGVYSVELPLVRPGDIAQIQYTSGTTGFPKGAQLTHEGLTNVGRLYASAIGTTSKDVWVNPMPLFHTAGCGLVTLGCLQTGGTQVLPPAYEPDLMLQLIEAERGTITLSVPTMLIRMLDHPLLATRDLSSWRLATLGGAPVPPELVRRATETLRLKVAIGYGLTEASGYFTHTQPDDPRSDCFLTVGQPLSQIEVKVVDPDSAELLPVDVVGEIWTRSVCVMKGYYKNPEATKSAITVDGWLRTGDLGSLDAQGYLSIQGRLKDMIIRGGENVYPREVEDLLFTHPAVANVSVVGAPDAVWGESVAAFVQFKPQCEARSEELETFCRERLASYKVPRIWRFVDSYPQTPSGKIQKFALREQLVQASTVQAAHTLAR